MESTLSSKALVRSSQWLSAIRRPERVALAFFIYLALLGFVAGLPATQRVALILPPVLLTGLWLLEARTSSTASQVIRQWSLLGLILLGYWSLGWFKPAPIDKWQAAFVSWDRVLLDSFHLRAAIESAGPLVPSLLETVYLLLYAIPPIGLGLVYWLGGRAVADKFLLCLLLGTFAAYALLPLFPVHSPRAAFPGADLPLYSGAARGINTWLLDHLDISTSVFPSGHVAVAFSSAIGLLAALRERRIVWISGFAAASGVYLATIYGRYHYAADGLASIAIAFAAWNISRRLGGDEG